MSTGLNFYRVDFPDGTHTILNRDLAAQLCLTDDEIELLKISHLELWELYEEMKAIDDVFDLRELALKVEQLEFHQQKLWKFNENRLLHNWHRVPKCICNKPNAAKDGRSWLPRRYFIKDTCPIHGL